MPPRTNTQRIDDLTDRVSAFEPIVQFRLNEMARHLEDARAAERRQQDLNRETTAKLAALEERCKALEKGSDRWWQFAPLVLSAIAILVSILVAVLRK